MIDPVALLVECSEMLKIKTHLSFNAIFKMQAFFQKKRLCDLMLNMNPNFSRSRKEKLIFA